MTFWVVFYCFLGWLLPTFLMMGNSHLMWRLGDEDKRMERAVLFFAAPFWPIWLLPLCVYWVVSWMVDLVRAIKSALPDIKEMWQTVREKKNNK